MSDSATVAAARQFIDLVTVEPVPTDAELAFALDELVAGYYRAPRDKPKHDDLPPSDGYDGWKERYRLIAARFPSYGYYAVSDPLKVVEDEPMVGDAIDDLADIVGDLTKVVRCAEVQSDEDAHWNFRFLFEIHWGRHARELAFYLHARQFG